MNTPLPSAGPPGSSRSLLSHVPNALTCGNLLCGCLGILWIIDHPSEYGAYFVWAACAFDFLDGFAARALKVSSAIGKELDSLADMVSFGVLPSMVMYSLIRSSNAPAWSAYFAFSVAVFSALRLARFNIDDRQKESFIGLPVPADALFITGIVFLPPALKGIISHPTGLFFITAACSFLLVSPLELFALKFKNFNWAGNQVRFTFLILAVLLLAWLQAGAISLLILLYIAISLVSRVFGTGK